MPWPDIGPENDFVNFLSVHLRSPYSVIMAESQQTGRYSPPGDEKVGIFHMYPVQNNEIVTIAIRRICNE